MKQYPDPHKHFEEYADQRAEEFKAEARKLGMTPNEIIVRRWAKRVSKEAELEYEKQRSEVFLHNFETIMEDHKQRMNEIKRSGASLRLKTCPPVALAFLIVGYVCYMRHDVITAATFLVLALVFLGFLVGGAIFDRPLR